MNSNKINTEIKKVCEEPITSTKLLSIKDIKVELFDYSVNPYISMCNMALNTWGLYNDKWKKLSPESRFYAVKEVLEGKALPLALEAPIFTFSIENVSRACFDQIARARIGVVYASKGTKDNDLNHLDFCIPSVFLKDRQVRMRIDDVMNKFKENYKYSQDRDYPNWANRCFAPMYVSHRFIMSINFKSLQQMCGGRMMTTEMEDTVALAWLLRERVKEKFPLLANYLRPACDKAKRDLTVAVNGFADILGIPHPSDNRHSGFKNYKGKVTWDESCSDIKLIEKELKIKIPSPEDWIDYQYEKLKTVDKEKFIT